MSKWTLIFLLIIQILAAGCFFILGFIFYHTHLVNPKKSTIERDGKPTYSEFIIPEPQIDKADNTIIRGLDLLDDSLSKKEKKNS